MESGAPAGPQDEPLRLSEARKSAILEAALDAIVSIDHTGAITEFNPAAERMFGRPRAEAIGKNLAALLIPERLRERHRAGLARYIATGEGPVLGKRVEMPALRADGSEFPVELCVVRIPLPGPPQFTAYLRDLTERKEIERERLDLIARERAAREQAEAASRLKDEFLAHVSHELRTPLTALLGWLQLLRANDPLTEKVREVLLRNATSLRKLISDLLDLSAIVTGRLSLEIRPIDLAKVAAAALDVVRPAAAAKSIRLLFSADSALPPVAGDPARLQQVLWNLLSNAVKFTAERGEVEIRLERSGSRSVKAIVSDTGKGIAPEALPQLFEPFRPGEIVQTTRGGLGLAIARRIVEAHGGTILAESAGPGRGARFTVELPAARRAPEAAEAEAPTGPAGAGAAAGGGAPVGAAVPAAREPARDARAKLAGVWILLVEDDCDTSDALRMILEDEGARVRTAATVREALAEIERASADALLIDIGLPDGDGYSLLENVRRAGRLTAVPAIALTASAREEDRRRALSVGFQEHVAKPFDQEELIRTIQRFVRAGQAAAARGPNGLSGLPG